MKNHPLIHIMNHQSALFFILLMFTLSACDSNSMEEDEPTAPVYVIQVIDQTFRVQISDSTVAAEADQLLQSGEARNIDGPLRAGDGDFNAPYNWHIAPDSINFSDVTIELCDGRPSMLEEDLDYWLNTVKAYCPWGVKVVGKE